MKTLNEYMENTERDYILSVLKQHNTLKEVADSLGISPKSLYNKTNKYPELLQYVHSEYIHKDNSKYSNEDIMKHFKLGFTLSYIADKFNVTSAFVGKFLNRKLGSKEYKKIKETTSTIKYQLGGNNKMTCNETNRLHLVEIVEKIRENKVEELSLAHMQYAKVLYESGYITTTGEVTKEGKDALYH